MKQEHIDYMKSENDISFISTVAVVIGNNPGREIGVYAKREILKALADYDSDFLDCVVDRCEAERKANYIESDKNKR